MRYDRDPVLFEIYKVYGNASKLAAALGITKQAVSRWKKVPAKYVMQICHETGIPMHKIRPDIYGQN